MLKFIIFLKYGLFSMEILSKLIIRNNISMRKDVNHDNYSGSKQSMQSELYQLMQLKKQTLVTQVLPMGAAPMAYTLWTKQLRHNPQNPNWYNRDRFVLICRTRFNASI